MQANTYFPEGAMDTLVDIARYRAANDGDRMAFAFVNADLEVEDEATFAELDRSARAIASALGEAGVERGARVLLAFPPGLDYVRSFLACLYAGAIAVPTYPPLGRNADVMRRIASDCGAAIQLTTRALAKLAEDPAFLPGLSSIAVEDVSVSLAEAWAGAPPRPSDVAFLQYTSGSTGMPKGVMVTHANLMHNEAMIGAALSTRSDDRWFTWLPIYHDMGLIGTVLHPLYSGARSYVMSPMDFVHAPSRWLEAVSRFRVTITGGPNFAYQLCVDRTTAAECAQLDLSSWRVAFNGAEPIRAATLEAFTERFGERGFRTETMRPCYGLAEATLLVAFSAPGRGPVVPSFDRAALEGGRAVLATDDAHAKLAGYRLDDRSASVAIVDPTTRKRVRDGVVGEIWSTGASVAAGYWNRTELTAATFHAVIADEEDGAPHLRTGDLGFVNDGHLFVTGRWKDVIIVRGRNYYPQDIEEAATEGEATLRAGCCVAFIADGDGDDARLVLVAEIDRASLATLDPVAAAENVRRAITNASGLSVHDVVLVKPGAVLKTSSGKLRRSDCKRLWAANEFDRLNTMDLASSKLTAPLTTPTEHLTATVFERVLGRRPAGRNTTVFELGADSIKMVTLARELEKLGRTKIPVAALYDAASLSEIAKLVDASEVVAAEVDLYREAELPADVVPAGAICDATSAKNVLVTGATGFLGAYLVAELLAIPGMAVTCLVRASDDATALGRVLDNLRKLGLDAGAAASRLRAVAGDLSASCFGWTAERYADLSRSIDSVYHSAATVDWSQPYRRLKSANVDATVEILRFACASTTKPVHHVSTMWVFPLGKGGDPDHPVDMENHLPRAAGLETGYNRSKWVAERLVAAARDRGVPVTIHRMDFITASSSRGGFKLTDLVPRLVRDAVNLGVLPSDDVRLDLVAVDTLAKMIVLLSRSQAAQGKAFHLLNHERLSLTKLWDILTAAGYEVDRLPYQEWKQRVTAHEETALFPLYPLLDSYDSEDLARSLIQGSDSRQAVAHLEALEPGLSRAHPSMDFVVRQMLDALRAERLIPEPPQEVRRRERSVEASS